MRAGSGAAVGLALIGAVAMGVEVSAHRLDEYLQAARIAIEPDRVELQLDLTPGVAVSGTIIADIDRDRDGRLSADEKRAYVHQVLSAIALELDGHALQLNPATLTFPDADALRSGEGTIHLQLSAALPPQLAEGAHQLSYRNGHRRDVSVYLANALVPRSDRVAVGVQLRDTDQRDLTIAYVLRGAPSTFPRDGVLLGIACAAGVVFAFALRSPGRTRHQGRSTKDLRIVQ